MEYKPISPYEKCVRTIKDEIKTANLANMNREQMAELLRTCVEMSEATINYCEMLGIE